MNKAETLRHYFGHDGFRPGQEAMVDALLAGRDALGIMPTGAGKSMCYQVPTLMQPGTGLVVSPLISLMKDQVAGLKAAGVPAAYINTSLTPRQIDLAMERAAQGQYKIIYVAPERLETAAFRRFAMNAPLSLIAVDEAHCVSQWGQDFRPTYLRIADFIACLPKRPPVGAFTATATALVREDILRLLQLRDPVMAATGFDRPNLYYQVIHPDRKFNALVNLLSQGIKGSVIVYCGTRKTVEEVAGKLTQLGMPVAMYHAGLSDETRKAFQEDFQFDRLPVMVATNAFGMGIDKPNVRAVIHYNMPKSMEAYYQEAGRAGRDGAPATCTLLYSGSDIFTLKFMLRQSESNPALTLEEQAEVRALDHQRMEDMIDYCTTGGCLRTKILRYFGEMDAPPCGHCGGCDRAAYMKQAMPQFKLPDNVHQLPMPDGPQKQSFPKVALPRARVCGKTPAVQTGKPDTLIPNTETQAPTLFEALRQMRLDLSRTLRVPPYIICDDRTLESMAVIRPKNLDDMQRVHGMGTAKIGKYGQDFLRVLRKYGG